MVLIPHTSIFKLYSEVGDLDSYTLIWAVFFVGSKKNMQLLTFVGLLDQDSSVLFVCFLFICMLGFSGNAGCLGQSPCHMGSMPLLPAVFSVIFQCFLLLLTL